MHGDDVPMLACFQNKTVLRYFDPDEPNMYVINNGNQGRYQYTGSMYQKGNDIPTMPAEPASPDNVVVTMGDSNGNANDKVDLLGNKGQAKVSRGAYVTSHDDHDLANQGMDENEF